MKDGWWKLLKGIEDDTQSWDKTHRPTAGVTGMMDPCPVCQQPKDSTLYADECGSCIDDWLARHHYSQGEFEEASKYPAYPETDNENWQDLLQAGEPMTDAWSSLLKNQPIPSTFAEMQPSHEYPQQMNNQLGQSLAAARQQAQQPKPPLQIQNLPPQTTQIKLPEELTAGATVADRDFRDVEWPSMR